MTARVSIVIPVYNGANYLREAIDSALTQTYPNVEILVVDDGSNDEGATEAIARSYGGRIRFLQQPNGGVSSALNRGIRGMTGDYFCWLSHDDRYLPAKIEKQVEFLQRTSGARIANCDFEIIDDRGAVTGVVRSPLTVVATGRELLETYVFGCALMIHRSCFEGTPFNEANRTTQDLEMWLSLIERDPIHRIPEVLAQVRVHPAQGSAMEPGYAADKSSLFAKMVDRYDATFFEPSATTPAARARTYDWVAKNALQRESLDGADHVLRRAWREMPSLRNPALLHIALGARGTLLSIRLRGWVRGKASAVVRRLYRWPRRLH